jgi:AmmeMemoRadiSam system protein B
MRITRQRKFATRFGEIGHGLNLEPRFTYTRILATRTNFPRRGMSVYIVIMRAASQKTSVRPPAVAGMFYPDDPNELRDVVTEHLARASLDPEQALPKALIVPHAGYVYSGAVAAAAYATIASARERIRRVVLVGPSHRVYLRGIAAPAATAFRTPLGDVPVDHDTCDALLERGHVIAADAPHAQEHSLEVQLPFLQMLLPEFSCVPLVAGAAAPEHVAATLQHVWDRHDTLVLISSDLSHYHAYDAARRIDDETNQMILRRSATLESERACGSVCINGLLHLAQMHDHSIREIRRNNSGDTAGDRIRVVGYGAYAIHERVQ